MFILTIKRSSLPSINCLADLYPSILLYFTRKFDTLFFLSLFSLDLCTPWLLTTILILQYFPQISKLFSGPLIIKVFVFACFQIHYFVVYCGLVL